MNYNNYNNCYQNDKVLPESIGPTTFIRNIERNKNNNNQMNNNQIYNNQLNNNQINYNQINANQIIYNEMNNNQMNDNQINSNLVMKNNIEMNNNNINRMNNNNFDMNSNDIGMNNNNFDMNNSNNFGLNNNIIGINNNNIGINNNNFDMNNNNNFGINNNIIGINNNNIGINNNNFDVNNDNSIFQINNQNLELNQIKNQLNPKRIISKNKDKIQNKLNIPDPIKGFIKPILKGLNSIDSSGFKNAVLQCLSQTENLTNYFLKKSNKETIFNNNITKENKNALQLCPAYYELIQNLWSKNEINSFSPQSFIYLIDQMNKDDILKINSDEDTNGKDFIIFILRQLHKELKNPLKSNNISINKKSPNKYDKEEVLKDFLTEFQQSYSIISDIFFGVNEAKSICLNCKNIYNSKGIKIPICYNYEKFNHLIFPLEEIKKMKNQKLYFNNINMSQNNIINLDDCFTYNEKDEYLTVDNQMFCNLCKQLSDSIYKAQIYCSPNVLILILNRGKGNEFNVKLDFKESIDITRFVLKKDMPKITYNLYGVITHIEENAPPAHFIASCKNPVDNKWYRYNDAFVTEIQDFQKEVINFGFPYILFYKKCL